MEALVFIGLFWIAPIFVGQKVGGPKGRAGWAWGLLLGWLGVLIVACMSHRTPHPVPVDPVLAAKQREIAELEAEVRLAELNQQKTALLNAQG